MTAFAIGRLHSRRSLTLLLGGIASIAMISFLLRGIDVNDFLSVLAVADVRVLMLVPIAIAGEHLVRAWKWRQVLYPMRPSSTLGLFGAIVLGNLAGLLIPWARVQSYGPGSLRAGKVSRRALSLPP